MLSRFFLISMCLGMACAENWIEHHPMKPKEFQDKEGCYVKEINDVVPFGESVRPIGNCYRIECGRHMLDYTSCAAVFTYNSSCLIVEEDLSKPYPQCCKTLKCDSRQQN